MLPDIWWSSGWSPSSLAITTTLFALLGSYYLTWRFSRFVRLIDALPGPKTLPLLGNLLHFVNFTFEKVIGNMAYNNRIYKMWISFYPIVFISHPELLKPIFSSTTNIGKPQEYSFVLPNALVTFTGKQWKNRRRMLNPSFHFQILNGFIDTFNDVSLGCVSKIDEIITATGSKEMIVSPIISKLVLDILCATTLGGNFNNVLSEGEWANYIKGIKGLEHIFMERSFYRPWLRMNWIFKLSSLYQQHEKIKSNQSATIEKIIKYRRELHEQNAVNCSTQSDSVMSNNNAEEQDKYSRPKEKLAVLDLLLKNSEEDPDFDDEEIGKELFDFITAGFDTTYVVFIWFFYLIAKHTDHQKLVMDELDLIFGDSDRPVTAEDLTELKYLECCIRESMRIYPPIPLIGRSITEDVQAGEYTLPKGIEVVLNIYAAHHNPEIFPDPETFKPERFLPENSVGRHSYAFVSFSAGPRICIAHKYAMMELKVCLANILRRFKFSLSDPWEPLPTPVFHLSLEPKNDQCLVVSKRFQ